MQKQSLIVLFFKMQPILMESLNGLEIAARQDEITQYSTIHATILLPLYTCKNGQVYNPLNTNKSFK